MNLFGEEIKERETIFAARDKMDDTHDAMRAVRSKDFKYILNLMPERAYCQYNEYKERQYPPLAVLNSMNLSGTLNPVQASFMAPTKPEEELYDLRNDPWETQNLADNAAFAGAKRELRAALEEWREMVGDEGVTPEFRAGGWPATYPTRNQKQWDTVVEKFKPLVFRAPGDKVEHPRNFIRDSSPMNKTKKEEL
jgi:arylsulfatase A-like enzyme